MHKSINLKKAHKEQSDITKEEHKGEGFRINFHKRGCCNTSLLKAQKGPLTRNKERGGEREREKSHTHTQRERRRRERERERPQKKKKRSPGRGEEFECPPLLAWGGGANLGQTATQHSTHTTALHHLTFVLSTAKFVQSINQSSITTSFNNKMNTIKSALLAFVCLSILSVLTHSSNYAAAQKFYCTEKGECVEVDERGNDVGNPHSKCTVDGRNCEDERKSGSSIQPLLI